ncbi:MAG TPA: cyanophycin synthetase [Pyrinomonadaceae bacterium]|nr:cyanophycin synthetase [Pyrinomonadaceae bacterium]
MKLKGKSVMKVESIRTLHGPNVYSYRPVLLMSLDLGELVERESREFNGFNDRLLTLLPGIHNHHCSLGRPGGFVTRLEEGTYFGHVVEHVALELTELTGIGKSHGKTRHDTGSIYNVAIEFRSEKASTYLLQQAVKLVEALVRRKKFQLQPVLDEAKRLVLDADVGPTTRAITEAAARRGIPCRRDGTGNRIQLGYGKHLRYVQAAVTSHTSAIAVELAQDKDETKDRLERNGIPVPKGKVVYTLKEANKAADEIGRPVVVKPVNGRQGYAVSLEVETAQEMKVAFQAAKEFSSAILIEEMLAGRNYRVVIVGGRMVAASERMLPHVIGDGASTIRDLIATENRNPLRGDGHEKPLTKIKVDSDVTTHLQHNGMTLDTVPNRGEHVTLSNRSNLSTGATAQDVTDQVHPSIARMCERAARLIGLDVCGVDLVIPDIATPITSGGVIELNASPGLRMHHFPSAGMPRDVGQAVVDAIFPEGAPSRIPIISITGTNGKTTVTRMIGHVLNATGLRVGMTTTDGIYIDGERVVDGDTTGPQSAQVVLADPAVEAAVLETARGGILRRGLGYDWSDIGVMTNISDDHVGQDGIKSVEDVLYIKSLVAERVKEGGTLILNADDEHLAKLMECERVNRVPRKVVYFSLDENNQVVRSHLESGGIAYFAKNKRLIEATGETQHTLADVSMLPVMMNGAADFQVRNLLATFAACRAFGIEHDVLLKSLINFSSWANNPGRANLYRLNGGHVMVDYGHNTEAFDAICRMTSKWNDRQVTGIITVPGDRDDSIIDRAARAAAKGFNKIIIREDRDLRGRKRGDVANILRRAITETSPATECEVILDEIEALRQAVSRMVKNEVIVVFYEKLEPVQTALQELAAQPVVALPPLVKQENTKKRLNAVNRPRRPGKRLVTATPPA